MRFAECAQTSIERSFAPLRMTTRDVVQTLLSDLQLLRETRKLPAAVLRDYHDVFLPRPSYSGIVKPRLHRQYLSLFQRDLLQSRIFMNLETESVSRTMKETNLPAFAHFGAIAAFSKKFLNPLVNLGAIHAGFDFSQRQSLSSLDRFPKLSLRIPRASANNRAR